MPPSSSPEMPGRDSRLSEHDARSIRECGLFRDLPSDALREVLASARSRGVKKGAVLHQEGEPLREFVMLARGRVKLRRAAASDPAALIQLIGPADVCEWPGMLTEDLHSTTAVAAEPSDVLFWDRLRMTELFDGYPVLYRNALRMMARRQRDLAERYRELRVLRVPQRLARTLLRLASPSGRWPEEDDLSEIPLSRRDLAQLAGTTLFTVSRFLSEWENKGLIGTRRESVRVEKPQALAVIGKLPGL